jgi:hypothetical protein
MNTKPHPSVVIPREVSLRTFTIVEVAGIFSLLLQVTRLLLPSETVIGERKRLDGGVIKLEEAFNISAKCMINSQCFP